MNVWRSNKSCAQVRVSCYVSTSVSAKNKFAAKQIVPVRSHIFGPVGQGGGNARSQKRFGNVNNAIANTVSVVLSIPFVVKRNLNASDCREGDEAHIKSEGAHEANFARVCPER